FSVEVELRTIFEQPTVEGLARVIKQARQSERLSEAPAIVREGRREKEELSYAQQRLWFIEQLEPGTSTYNISVAVMLEGAVDFSALRESSQEVLRRHEVLRTRYEANEGSPLQV